MHRKGRNHTFDDADDNSTANLSRNVSEVNLSLANTMDDGGSNRVEIHGPPLPSPLLPIHGVPHQLVANVKSSPQTIPLIQKQLEEPSSHAPIVSQNASARALRRSNSRALLNASDKDKVSLAVVELHVSSAVKALTSLQILKRIAIDSNDQDALERIQMGEETILDAFDCKVVDK